MELLQRIQRWYTINCNGDWEHSYGVSIWHGISIQTLDNPGWTVSINLAETCLKVDPTAYSIDDRTPTDWVSYSVKDNKFEAAGGPENLTEILSYFLDTFLPAHIDPNCTLAVHLPVHGYENQLWLRAEARMLSETAVEIVTIADPALPVSYRWRSDQDLDLLWCLEPKLGELQTQFTIGDIVEPVVYQEEDNMFRTYLVTPAKKS